MINEFDPEKIRLGQVPNMDFANKSKTFVVYRPKSGEQFLKGPIPWRWICDAAKLSGRALQVALVLWRLVGLKKTLTVSLNQSRLTEVGVSRDSARRGLLALERNRLVSVFRRQGRKAVVTILNQNTDNNFEGNP